MNLDPRIGVLNSGVYYAFAHGYNKPETRGTLEEVEIALGLRAAPPAPKKGRKTKSGGFVLSFGKIKGKLLVVETYEVDGRICADVRCGEHGCSLSLLSDYGTVDEDGPEVAEEIIDAMVAWALTKGW
jgi:hypothetical protein